jgi:hypothetical protein
VFRRTTLTCICLMVTACLLASSFRAITACEARPAFVYTGTAVDSQNRIAARCSTPANSIATDNSQHRCLATPSPDLKVDWVLVIPGNPPYAGTSSNSPGQNRTRNQLLPDLLIYNTISVYYMQLVLSSDQILMNFPCGGSHSGPQAINEVAIIPVKAVDPDTGANQPGWLEKKNGAWSVQSADVRGAALRANGRRRGWPVTVAHEIRCVRPQKGVAVSMSRDRRAGPAWERIIDSVITNSSLWRAE